MRPRGKMQLGFISFFLYAALFQGVTCCVLIEKNTSRVAQTTYVSSWLSGSSNIVFTFDGALFKMSYVLFKSLVGQFSLSLAHFYWELFHCHWRRRWRRWWRRRRCCCRCFPSRSLHSLKWRKIIGFNYLWFLVHLLSLKVFVCCKFCCVRAIANFVLSQGRQNSNLRSKVPHRLDHIQICWL